MNVLVISILHVAFMLTEVSAFVTRLPACKYSANYSIIQEGKYFKGVINITIPMVSRRRCTLYCTLRESCVFFNVKEDGTTCELLASHIGTLEDKPGWSAVSTNYTEWRYRGPMCRFLRPLCNFDKEYCIDMCEAPGYRCQKLVNVAKGKATSSSGTHKFTTSYLVDEDPATYWVSKKSSTPWVMVDLAKAYKILFITLINRTPDFMERMSHLMIKIGNNNDKDSNEICLKNQQQVVEATKNYFCKQGPIIGRYVVVIRAFKDYFNFAELMVYSL